MHFASWFVNNTLSWHAHDTRLILIDSAYHAWGINIRVWECNQSVTTFTTDLEYTRKIKVHHH